MADLDSLLARYRSLAPELLRLAESGKRMLVVTHIDADGLCSGSIVFRALAKKGAVVALRTVRDLDEKTIEGLAQGGFDFYIFTDLGASLVAALEGNLGGRFLVVDHHQISEADAAKLSVVNAWAFGLDGGTEACSSSMAYFLAAAMDPDNRALSPLAVVGALADRQDAGPGRSLVGLNAEAAAEAESAGLLLHQKDLMFTGRETRPIHEAVALTSTPYLRGLTGNKDTVLATLHNSGITLKEKGSWRTIASLTTEEKMKLTETIAGSLGGTEGATEAVASLVGESYTFAQEDAFTPLRDAREFGTLLNSCGRMGASGTGIAVCLGDRSEALKDAMKTLSEYRAGLTKSLEALSSDPTRVEERGGLVIVKGEGVVDERLLGPVVSILTSSPAYVDKVLVGTAKSGEEALKVSAREGDDFPREVNLGTLMKDAAAAVGGVGGGHSMAAGAKIPVSGALDFIKKVEEGMSS